MSRKKKLTAVLITAAAVIAAAAVYAYVVFYDGLGLMGSVLSWTAQLPEGTETDGSMGRLYTTYTCGGFTARVSVESSPYLDKEEYISYYFDRFAASPDWQAANGAVVLRDGKTGGSRVLSLRVDSIPEGMPDVYAYVTRSVPGTRYFLRALVKYGSGDTASEQAAERFIETLRPRLTWGKRDPATDFAPVIPSDWTPETLAAYEKLRDAESPYFGVFTADVSLLEERLGRHMPIALLYFAVNEEPPIERMEILYGRGKLTELTLQLTANGNSELYAASSPLLDVLNGRYDETLTSLARRLRDFGHPVLFRLNNEMDSDWTSYSGVVNLSDPDIYVAAWRYVYELFDREGARNLIWVWNPNDRDYPPANWNSYLAYWPGNEYVQVLGITGYNTGTYYKEQTGETWRGFREIYDGIYEKCLPHFERFPWMITEFASSSVGGDKVGWIDDMFREMSAYPEIKAAVWFDYADFDYSKPDAPVARPYWLTETEETLEAFRRGLEGRAETFFPVG